MPDATPQVYVVENEAPVVKVKVIQSVCDGTSRNTSIAHEEVLRIEEKLEGRTPPGEPP